MDLNAIIGLHIPTRRLPIGVDLQIRKRESCTIFVIHLHYRDFFYAAPFRAEVLGSELLLMIFSFSPFRGLFWPGSFFPAFRIWIPKTVQKSALCRSRRELSNEILIPTSIYLLKLASIQPRISPVKILIF